MILFQDGGEGGFRDNSRRYREAEAARPEREPYEREATMFDEDFVTALAASAQREPRDPLGHREGPPAHLTVRKLNSRPRLSSD